MELFILVLFYTMFLSLSLLFCYSSSKNGKVSSSFQVYNKISHVHKAFMQLGCRMNDAMYRREAYIFLPNKKGCFYYEMKKDYYRVQNNRICFTILTVEWFSACKTHRDRYVCQKLTGQFHPTIWNHETAIPMQLETVKYTCPCTCPFFSLPLAPSSRFPGTRCSLRPIIWYRFILFLFTVQGSCFCDFRSKSQRVNFSQHRMSHPQCRTNLWCTD